MFDRTGKQLERLVAAIEAAQSQGAHVTWDDTIEGRQFDVTVRFKFGMHTYLTVIECKQHSSKVSVDKVDALVTKARDAKANKAVLVSTKGFQSGCHAVAERHGVQLLVVTERSEVSAEELAQKLSPALNVFGVRLVAADGTEVELEDWGGRLDYLMKQSRIRADGAEHSPEDLINRWQETGLDISPEGASDVELPLGPGACFEAPLEPPIEVVGLRFKTRFIEVRLTSAPVPDLHIQQSLMRQVEVHDGAGNLVHTAKLASIPLGFDTTLVAGEFYELPSLFNRYYCEKIEGGVVTWIVVESYQFGNLMQATLTQKLKYRSDYVRVTDEGVRLRLRRLLERYRGRRASL